MRQHVRMVIITPPKQHIDNGWTWQCFSCREVVDPRQEDEVVRRADGRYAHCRCVPVLDETPVSRRREPDANKSEDEIRQDLDERTTEGKRRRNKGSGYSGGDGMHGI